MGHIGGHDAASGGWRGPVSAGVSQCSAWSGPIRRLQGWLIVFMVRRRSTVRFRKEAPGHGTFSNGYLVPHPPKNATRVAPMMLSRLA